MKEPPGSPWRLLVGGAIAAGLIMALIWSSLVDPPQDTPNPDFVSAPVAGPPAPTSTSFSVTTTTAPPVPDTTVEVAAEIQTAVDAALLAWRRFAATGDLGVLNGHFHPDSPQHPQLITKAADLAIDPLGDPPYRFVLDTPEITIDADRATVVGEVVTTRSGEELKSAQWQLELVRVEGSSAWLVRTLTEAE